MEKITRREAIASGTCFAGAVKSGVIELLMFSVNPAYDLLPPIENLMSYFQRLKLAGRRSNRATASQTWRLAVIQAFTFTENPVAVPRLSFSMPNDRIAYRKACRH